MKMVLQVGSSIDTAFSNDGSGASWRCFHIVRNCSYFNRQQSFRAGTGNARGNGGNTGM